MNRYDRWNAILIAAGFLAVLIGGRIVLCAQEKKEIPNHAEFQSCKECHGEKLAMWESSGHGKAIRRFAANNPSAADCSGCHPAKRPEAGRQNVNTPSAGEAIVHRVACLACHAKQKTAFDHRLVIDHQNLSG